MKREDGPNTHAEGLRVILASQSPRRSQLLTLIGIPHEVMPAHVDETLKDGELPTDYCNRLALAKTRHVALQYPEAVVVGSDTIVLLGREVLGKPVSENDAVSMLRRLAGQEHTVHTAVAVSYCGRVLSGVESVRVRFRQLDESLIASYVATREPMDKAGSYGIQGFGATIVERIDGDYFAVMGLPVGRMIELIRELGLSYDFGPLTL